MKKVLTITFSILLNLSLFAQVNYQKGYFIDNSDKRTECLIKDIDNKYNPEGFTYRLTEGSESQNATINSVKEFGIYNKVKYSRSTVMIDYSDDDLARMSKNKLPDFREEKVFLQVLIEGNANLYSYQNSAVKRYFFSKENLKIEQLVYKEYLNQYKQILENNEYKQQIFNNLKCSSISMSTIQNVKYGKKSLINFFEKYNECTDGSYKNFENKEKKDLFNLSVRLGVSNNSLNVENGVTPSVNVDFGKQTNIRFGIEAEYIMPFHNNKWSIIFEPTYNYFKADQDITAFFQTQNAKVDYTSIELPIGIRHNFFINDHSSIFANVSLVVDISSKKSMIDYENRSDLDIKSSSNLALGIGYKYLDRYSFECRYHFERNVLTNYSDWVSQYKTLSFIVGYSFL